jgi:hypothetical protein
MSQICSRSWSKMALFIVYLIRRRNYFSPYSTDPMLNADSVLITRFEILGSFSCYIIILSNIYSKPRETGRLESLKHRPKSVHDMFIQSVTQDNTVYMSVWITQLTVRYIYHCRQARCRRRAWTQIWIYKDALKIKTYATRSRPHAYKV